ncbi:hypothetical protein KY308_01805 [Candidatus Woesearchaeota archaeon]|nr:hypothetical protein [Candidatus Woesearchaeota archaeon]
MRRMLWVFLVAMVIVIGLIASPKEQQYKSMTGKALQGASSVSFGILSACGNIPLRQGWNFISVCSNMTDKTIAQALYEINGSYRYVMEWNESAQEFLIYSPLAAQNPFYSLNENKSYFIYFVPNQSELNPSGELFDNVTVNMLFGWNAPVYPYEDIVNISKSLETIDSQYRYVMKWNATEQRFLIYSPLATDPEFTEISRGEGQFIYIQNTSGATLKYNRSILS